MNVGCDVITTLPTVTYKVFEYNQSCIAVAESKKLLARTKHVAIKYHHFKNLVDDKVIKISYINTKKKLADILTKPIDDNHFLQVKVYLNRLVTHENIEFKRVTI